MALWTRYHLAKNLEEALEILSRSSESARLIAGGTDLLIDLQQGRHPPVHTLVDISSVPELTCLEVRGKRLFIGAAVPLNKLIESPLVIEHAQAVVEACRLIGGPQVRSVATLGGNVAHALPGADGTIALMSLDAQVEIRSSLGFREVPLGDLFVSPGKSALDPRNEILTGFYLTMKGSHQASRFERIMRPQGVALPILNIAVWVECEREIIHDVRIALGPAGLTPRRATAAEQILRNERCSDEHLQHAYLEMLKQLTFRTSPFRASADYRRSISEGLFKNAIKQAFERSLS